MLARIHARLRAALSWARLRVLDRATPRERELIDELRQDCRRLPARAVSGASAAGNTWAAVANYFRHLVATEDPRRFLTWPHLRTMFIANASYAERELAHLQTQPDWEPRWRTGIRESLVGYPAPFPSYPGSSGNLIHHAYHLCRFEQATRHRIDDFDLVVEFGGGYGSMARLFHALGFKGSFVIFDLPEFASLQRFFLKSLDLPVCPIGGLLSGKPGIATLSEMLELQGAVPALGGHARRSLFIATWSLSEAPLEVRSAALSMAPWFDSYLLAYQQKFGEVENAEFFRNWSCSESDFAWQTLPIEQIPGSSYLFGIRQPSSAVRSPPARG
jgi:hypothetical protein